MSVVYQHVCRTLQYSPLNHFTSKKVLALLVSLSSTICLPGKNPGLPFCLSIYAYSLLSRDHNWSVQLWCTSGETHMSGTHGRAEFTFRDRCLDVAYVTEKLRQRRRWRRRTCSRAWTDAIAMSWHRARSDLSPVNSSPADAAAAVERLHRNK
jgi:hypothetical protein